MNPARWSVARQLLALQVLLILLVVGVGSAAVFVETRRDTEDRARDRVVAVARTVAASPTVLAAVTARDPSATLQPYAERVRRSTGVDFVVVMAPDRTRWSHPNPAEIGRPFVGSIAPALAGRTFTETYTGTLGPSVRAVTPVTAGRDRVVALVAVGIRTTAISHELTRQLPALLLVGLLVLAVAVAGAVLVSRRLRRQTHGLGPAEITRMYEYYDAVLHSVREGLVVLDRARRVQLVNDEARRLLGLGDRPVAGVPAGELDLPPSLAELLRSGRPAADEVHLTADRVLVANARPAVWDGRPLGVAVTLRDHTELQALTGELDSIRGLTDSLRSQAHEAANRLHTVVSLIELGRAEEAVDFATAELELAQRLTDRVLGAVEEPVLSALLLGKAAQASERGVDLDITDDSLVRTVPMPGRDLVTLVGNLVDNAIDAAADAPPPRTVRVTVREDDRELLVRVADSGRGVDPDRVDDIFRRGWSTKPASTEYGRGLGLALVGQVVHRYGGRIDVGRAGGALFTVRVPLPDAPAPDPAPEPTTVDVR